MMNLLRAVPAEILDALDGVAYATDRQGLIFLAGGAGWSGFSAENGAFLPPTALFGRNLFEIIAGEEVRAAYRAIHDKVVADRTHLGFEYRCDGPAVERRMRMSIGPVVVAGEVAGVLYHSTLVAKTGRPTLDFLSDNEILRRRRAAQDLPTVTVCAWCADVSDGEGDWVKPQMYDHRRGAAEVRLSHGVCPSCQTGVVAPLLDGSARAMAGASPRSAGNLGN